MSSVSAEKMAGYFFFKFAVEIVIREKNVIYWGVAVAAGRSAVQADSGTSGRELLKALVNEIEVAFFALQSYVFPY